MYRSNVARINKELADLGAQISRDREAMNRANAEATRILSSLSGNLNFSTLQSRQRDITRKNDDAARYEKKVAELEKCRAAKLTELNRNVQSLENAVASERRNQDQQDKRRRDTERQHNREITRELEAQLRVQRELQHSSFSINLTKLPTKITVLFIASNPADQQQLRLDEEVREIDRMMRHSEHRDALELKTWWAARPRDLIQALNEHQPTILHFSGHGDEAGNLVFQQDDGGTKLVTPEAIAGTIATMAEHVELVVFNACFSDVQAAMVTNHIPAAIGMSQAVGDDAARTFAAQFYSTIGFGQPLQKAYDQARAAIMLEGIPEADTPQLFIAPEVDANDIVFVRSE